LGIGGCDKLCFTATGLSLVTLFSLSVLIEDRPLLWIVVRSQIYYSKTHTCLWEWEGLFSSCRGFQLFPDRLIGGGKGGGLSTALRPGLKYGGLESKFGWDLDPSTRVEWVGIVCAWGTSEACVFGVTSWATVIRESSFLRDGTT
jgi:hypothetical protein